MPKYAVYEKQTRVVVHEVDAEDEYAAKRYVSNEVLDWDHFNYIDTPFEGYFENVVLIPEEENNGNI